MTPASLDGSINLERVPVHSSKITKKKYFYFAAKVGNTFESEIGEKVTDIRSRRCLQIFGDL